MKIAVISGLDGRTATLFDAGTIKVYENGRRHWKLSREESYSIDSSKGLKEVRSSLNAVVTFLSGTKAIVGREVAGLPYNILEAAGFNIYEIDGTAKEFLDFVHDSELKESKSSSGNMPGEQAVILPEETEISGNYYINLMELQSEQSGVTSKQVLLPFLKNTTFHELNVVCSHIPPWFDKELDKLGLRYVSARIRQNEYQVEIHHKTCNSRF